MKKEITVFDRRDTLPAYYCDDGATYTQNTANSGRPALPQVQAIRSSNWL